MLLEKIAKNNNWLFEKISDVTFYQEGPGVRKIQYTQSGVKLLNVGNMQEGKIDLSLTDRYISEDEAYGRYNHFLADEGDLIIACSGIQVSYFHKKIGFVKKEHLPLCMNTSTMRFKSLDKNILNLNYFSYFLKTNYLKKQLQKLITGSAQLNFGPSHIQQIGIIIPPINIQKQIVEVLDESQKLIDNRKEQIKLLDDLIESIFYDMFGDPVRNDKGWEVKKLGRIVDGDIRNGLYKPNKDYTLDINKGTPIIRIDGFYDGKITAKNHKRVMCNNGEIQKYSVEIGDILINRVNSLPYLGKSAYINNITEETVFESNMMKFRIKKDLLNNNYFIYLLNTQFIKNQILGRAKQSVNQASINQTDVKSFRINIPPLELQNKFAEEVELIESQKQLLKDSLKLLEDNYKGLMKKAFKGELFN